MGQTWKSRVPKFYRMLLVTEVHELHSNSSSLILFYFVFLYKFYPVPGILPFLLHKASLFLCLRKALRLFLNIVTLQASQCSFQYQIALVFRSHSRHFYYHLFWFFEKCGDYTDSSPQTTIQGHRNNNALCSSSLLPFTVSQWSAARGLGSFCGFSSFSITLQLPNASGCAQCAAATHPLHQHLPLPVHPQICHWHFLLQSLSSQVVSLYHLCCPHSQPRQHLPCTCQIGSNLLEKIAVSCVQGQGEGLFLFTNSIFVLVRILLL